MRKSLPEEPAEGDSINELSNDLGLCLGEGALKGRGDMQAGGVKQKRSVGVAVQMAFPPPTTACRACLTTDGENPRQTACFWGRLVLPA